MHLPQVDVVYAEAVQRSVQPVEQRAAGVVHESLVADSHHAGLGGDDQFVAWDHVSQQLAEYLLGVPGGVRQRSVHERPTGVVKGH